METTFVSSYQEDRKNEGLKNRDSTVVVISVETSHTDHDRFPSKIKNLLKKQ